MSSSKTRTAQGGFTYLGLLFALALLGLALGAAGTVWSVVRQRDREQQLLWAGGEIRRAIGHYYQAGPGGLRAFPRSLQDLVEDRRGAAVVRHLRSAYPDPMTPTGEWELIRGSDGALTGVASKAKGQPMKQKGFAEADRAFEDAECYCDWRFVYLPQLQQRPGKAGTATAVAPSGSAPAAGPTRREVLELTRGVGPAR
jgi:type II secretory pathway pseudopilin PulG